MPLPTQLGQPCWDAAQVAKVISLNAQTNTQAVDYFLAAHSPFRFITNFRNPGKELTEEQVFQDIFAAERNEVLSAVKGEPGTGKSHLVHWLKLRTDFAVQSGDARFSKVIRVLVQRGNGSLKDALRQIVEQLGPEFKDQLARVQSAIENLSAETARATLLSKLALEIDYHWKERGRPPLSRGLQHLGQSLKSNGVGRWLLRESGTLDRVIRRLTERSTVKQREEENFPSFTVEELDPKSQFLGIHENAQQVRAFFEDMDMEPELRDEAVAALNIALHDAVVEFTGLSGTTLQEVFLEIRRKLGKGKVLALFIEDVSVTGLDRDVINALEPQPRNDLCRLMAVIGITSNAWGLLEQAQMQRVSPVYEIGAEMTERWSSNADEVANFTARYLNAVRLNATEIGELARARFDGDVSRSKCDVCQVRTECHETFGSVALGNGVKIGMFPFTNRAPQALLLNLRESGDTTGVARSQRGLLENVLRPILQDSRTALEEKEFPRPAAIALQAVPVPEWDQFANGWLGGWDDSDKRRFRMLAEFWVQPGRADELASELQSLLKPLGFQAFAKAAKKIEKRDEKKDEQKKVETKREVDPALARLLTAIDDWSRGEKLQRDKDFRELISNLISRSIAWEDERGVPFQEFKARVETSAFPYIEGQSSRSTIQPYFFELPRDEETRSLLTALAQFKYKGGGSWNYEGGELHKRTVSRWLRKNRSRAVAVTSPAPPLDKTDAVRVAAQLLTLAALIRDRTLSDDPPKCIQQLFAPVWDERTRPLAFSPEMRELLNDLEKRHSSLRELVLREVGAGQGRVEAKDFIDPQPLLTAVESLRSELKIDLLPLGFGEGAWKSRFYHVANLVVYSNVSLRVAAERKRIGEKAAEAFTLIRKGGCDNQDPRAALQEWLRQFIEVIELQRGRRGRDAALPHPNADFDALWEQGSFRKRGEVWGTALCRGTELKKAEINDVLTFDPAVLAELVSALTVADRHLKEVDAVLAGIEEELVEKGAGNRDALLAELAAFPFADPSTSRTGSEANE